VWPLVEVEASEKKCCICLKSEELGKLLALVSCLMDTDEICVECSLTCDRCRTFDSGHFDRSVEGRPDLVILRVFD
jgi:hypothetical protein